MELELKIAESRRAEALAKMAKLARKAAKLGVTGLSGTWGEPFVEKVVVGLDEGTGKTIYRLVHFVNLSLRGEMPRVGDYVFVARLKLLPENKVMVQVVPGHSVPEQFWHADGHCDHCKSKRFRKDVFVVRDAAGQHMQVGRQCLQDFLGQSPEQVLGRFGWLKAVREWEDEFGGLGSGYQPSYDVVELLTDAATSVRVHGWVSKGMASAAAEKGGRLKATADWCFQRHSSHKADKKEFQEQISDKQNNADRELAGQTLAWVRSLGHPGNEYPQNLVTALSGDFLWKPQHTGLAVSAISAYLRNVEREAELNIKRKKDEASQHVGSKGQRLRDVPVTLERVIGLGESQWGYSTLYKFRDDAGNILTWITNGDVDLGIGGKTTLTGTVKDHRDYKGVQETLLTRVVLAGLTPVMRDVLHNLEQGLRSLGWYVESTRWKPQPLPEKYYVADLESRVALLTLAMEAND